MGSVEKAKRLVGAAAVSILAIVFLWAGISKALDPTAFRESILGFKLIGGGPATAAAYYIPWLEIICAMALLSPSTRIGGLWLVSGLLFTFTGALIITCARGIDPGCGCFGATSATGCIIPIARNLVLIGLAVSSTWCYMRSRRNRLAVHCT
jgi:hypothetical protein